MAGEERVKNPVLIALSTMDHLVQDQVSLGAGELPLPQQAPYYQGDTNATISQAFPLPLPLPLPRAQAQ